MEKNELEKDEIQKKHDKLTSILQDAHKALNSINKKDVNEIKSFTFPPTLIKLTMQSILILLGRKTSVKAKEDPLKQEIWDESRKLLSDPNSFLKSLMDFNLDSVSEEMIKKLTEIFEANSELSPEKVKRLSLAAGGLCAWVKAIHSCHEIQKELKPYLDAQKKGEKEEVKAENTKPKAEVKEKIEKKEEEKKQEAERPKEKEKNTILQEALKEIKALKKADITEIKSFANPPPMVLFTMHLVVLLLSKDPIQKPKPAGSEWKQAQILMNNPNQFLEEIIAFDLSKVSEDVMKQVKEIIDSKPDFKPEIVAQTSLVAKSFCRWVLGMSKYYELQKK